MKKRARLPSTRVNDATLVQSLRNVCFERRFGRHAEALMDNSVHDRWISSSAKDVRAVFYGDLLRVVLLQIRVHPLMSCISQRH